MTEPTRQPSFHSGFITIAGAPNVGKSTLLNYILGEKISITSKKPQTTRNRILGIRHRPGSQMIFLDTPGIHKATKELNVRIVDTAISVLGDADLILAVADVARPDPPSENILIKNIQAQGRPAVLALNKIDLVPKTVLLEMIDAWSGRHAFSAIVPVSAKHGTQVEQLLIEMNAALPEGPPYFPEDALTDLPERFLAAEMIREKVFRLTGQEIPYATAVTVERYKEPEASGSVRIHATIHVERPSQKGMIIGKGGTKLKQIGEAARKEIQRLVGRKVFLKLFVRVQKNWSKDTKALRRFGY
ncbi:GTP-binding protein Era [Olavius algarvensis associated proteobacterium Delta 3]|nr:GTP-binding protein Era [Olavius algarvensis associated proteobacterium Delta 3]CAB5146438.1 GTP-binding protein Era [Olavius algarvensis associated proteobacterium Delta 3]